MLETEWASVWEVEGSVWEWLLALAVEEWEMVEPE